MADLRIGTCSWKYDSWRGLVYPSAGPLNYLAEYAQHYSTVEIDQWFWSLFPGRDPALPNRADVEAYRRSVPSDFRFSVKLPNSLSLTHYYGKAKGQLLTPNPWFLSADLLQVFLARIEPLRDVLGPLILQFEYLNLQKMDSQARFQTLLEGLSRCLPAGYQWAVEVRNPRYLNESHFELLNRAGLIPVLLQGYYMPPIVEVYARLRSLILKQKLVVLRLHGPDREGMEERTGKRWDEIVAPMDEELAAIAAMVRDLLAAGTSVYVNTNNHYEGSAPLTIRRLRQIL
jgi:uncharacterized protein YecE (DUF72 family)